MEAWAALERQTLVVLVALAVLTTTAAVWRRSRPLGCLAGAAVGAMFFVWIAGVRIIAPTEVDWTFKFDWRIHFLGWHFFRQDSWHLPPGRMENYFAPLGTAVGFTDSIPMAALPLKLFAPLLPTPLQYLGAWLLLCFTLQGFFGALIASVWTRSAIVQVLSAGCLVLVPTLLMRVGHPALCAHWLLLWALWLYLRVDAEARPPFVQIAALGLVAGLVHPYLAVMVIGLVGALGVRVLLAARELGRGTAMRYAAVVFGLAVAGPLAGWWISGLFTVSGVGNLTSEGLGKYSLNLLAPITPTGWSRWLPEWPLGAEGQSYEGFHYFGAGLLGLIVSAVAARLWRPTPRIAVLWPVAMVCFAFMLYALSPRVTLGASVVADLNLDWLERSAIFRATARFFWPTAYLAIVVALGSLVLRLKPRSAGAILAGLLALQLADLHGPHMSRQWTRRDPTWYTWNRPLTSPIWRTALPHYDHMVLAPPPHCGPPPTSFEAAAYLAGIYGLSINGGLVARFDEAASRRSCEALGRWLTEGEIDDRTVYLANPVHIPGFRAAARRPMRCGVLDAVGVCVTARSYAAWQSAGALE